jgi:hypothetical protein
MGSDGPATSPSRGDSPQVTEQIVGLYIDGKPVKPQSKHTRLRQVKAGTAPLGTK